jgi:hypothetical protein
VEDSSPGGIVHGYRIFYSAFTIYLEDKTCSAPQTDPVLLVLAPSRTAAAMATMKRQRSAADEAPAEGDGEEVRGGLIGSPPRRRSCRIVPRPGARDAGTVGPNVEGRHATGASSTLLKSSSDAGELANQCFEGADASPPPRRPSAAMIRAQFVSRALRRLTPEQVRERYRSLPFPSPLSLPALETAVGRQGYFSLLRIADAVDYARVAHYELTDLSLLTECPHNVEMLLRFVDDKDRPVWITDRCFLLKEQSERTLHRHLMTIGYTLATKIRGRTVGRCLHLYGPRAFEAVHDEDGSDDEDDNSSVDSSEDGSEDGSILAVFDDGNEGRGGDAGVVDDDEEAHVREGIDVLLQFVGMPTNVTRLSLCSDRGSFQIVGQDVEVRYPFPGTAHGLRALVASIRAPIEFTLEGFRLSEDRKEALAAGWDPRVRVQFALMEWVHHSGISVLVEAIRTHRCPANLDLFGLEILAPDQMQVLADALVENTCLETFRISALPFRDVSRSMTVRTLVTALPRNTGIRSLTIPVAWLRQHWSTFWSCASKNQNLKSIVLTGATGWVPQDGIMFLAQCVRSHNTTLERLEFEEPLRDPDLHYDNRIRPVLALNRFRAVADSIRRMSAAVREGRFVRELVSSPVRSHASFAFVLLSANPDLLVRCLPRRAALVLD